MTVPPAKNPMGIVNSHYYAIDPKHPNIKKRQTRYFTNIYSQNEGKVMVFEFGAQVFKLIQEALNPTFEGDPKFNPFCMWTGANLNLRITKNTGTFSYESSRWSEPGQWLVNEDEMELRWKETKDLEQFTKVETFDVLKSQVISALGTDAQKILDNSLDIQ